MVEFERISEEELYNLRMKLRKIVEEELEPLGDEMDKTNVYPEKMWEIGKKYDLFRMTMPKEYGGMGLGKEQWFTLLEEFGRGNNAFRMFFHIANGMGWEIMYDHGCDELKQEWLPKLATGDKFIAFALTEEGCGTGADIQSTGVKKGDKWVLNGKKTLISFTDVCDAINIVVITDDSKRQSGGAHTTFMVPVNTPGLRMENMPHMMGCRGVGHAYVYMENLEIDDKYRMGPVGEGLSVAVNSLAISRGSMAVCMLGISQRLLELSIKRANERVTFGKPLIKRQAIQSLIADMATDIHALRLMVHDCGYKFDNDLGDLDEITSMCKLFATKVSKECTDSALEIFGGIGYFEDNPYGPVERLYRDCRALWLEEGPPTIQRLNVLRAVNEKGGEFRINNYF
ncbi:MAG: acyl-CoA dehydrogenase family protein [Christensenella sp.]|uniref:acyl-CoA dehydrogenase family protein n=1 Tax=Christensenella sp. TaxID=1935934 RepID=UPI002B210D41|nr:acyl-CoA dehydrogenase family protein [Christensenella sp.]MEA5002511.1 acyl-CoA dehydrogenase family protein [Christensenella sp.]